MERAPQATLKTKVVLAVWQNRLAPLFDVAQQLLIVEVEAGRIIRRREAGMPDVPASSKAVRLVEMGAQILICGAISESLLAMIMGHGIRVMPFLAGDVAEIEQALLSNSLDSPKLAMPGWRKRQPIPSTFVGRPTRSERRVHGRNAQDR
jgi:predicted Fe-Mo cluster-binding NifX family protein